MSNIKSTNNFSFQNTQDFFDFVKSENSNLYVFLAKSDQWEDDENPPVANISQKDLYKLWDEISVFKKIDNERDVILGIKKIDWELNKVYTAYDDQLDLKDAPFYIFTPENNLYICIDNNNNSISLDVPNHKNISQIVEESDGYKWKFITEITNSFLNKFVIPGFIPFNEENFLVKTSATPGTIDRIKIEVPGFGYESNANLPVFIEGNGDQHDIEDRAIIDIITSQSFISSFSFVDRGKNYQSDIPGTIFPVAIRQKTSENGVVQNAYGIATKDINGNISFFKILSRGNGYVNGPAEIIQSSSEAIAQTDEDGSIISINIKKPGSNFFKAKCVILTENSNQQITQPAILRPIISPLNGFGAEQFRDLFAHYILFSLNFFSPARFGIPLEEFRTVGIIDSPLSNVLDFDSDNDSDGNFSIYKDSIGDNKGKLKINTSNTLFSKGETIIGETSGAIGNSLALFRTDIIRYSKFDDFLDRDEIHFIPNERVLGKDSGAIAEILEVIEPDILKYSGQILTINNIEPIDFSNNQNIIVTFVINF